MKYYAHILRENPEVKQLLKEHLNKVAEYAIRFAKNALSIAPYDTIEIINWKKQFYDTALHAGMLHDLGKYRLEFQEYLHGKMNRSKETNHAVYGAAAAWQYFGDAATAFATSGHHAGLYNCADLDTLINGGKYEAAKRYPFLLALTQSDEELGTIPIFNPISVDDNDDEDKRRYELMSRVLFSIIVDADRLDAERWEMEQKTRCTWQRPIVNFDAKDLLNKICDIRNQKKQGHPDNDLNRIRNAIFDACVQKGETIPQGFFSLTVPTGGGKTLASMAFALAHAKQHDLRRVIVVIPYLSIIEQNAKEYRDALGADVVLEHHSAVERPPQVSQLDDSGTSDDPSEASDMDKTMENWDVPVIVTTSVQFIETLFAAAPGQARKLHNIPKSVVIFDEVQTLPTHLLEPTLNILRELKNRWGVTFLFCSATQPAFKKSCSLKNGFEEGEVIEIAPEPKSTFTALRRVNYDVEPNECPWDWQMVAERMLSQPQALCILNIRRQAFELWKALNSLLRERGYDKKEINDALFHLSSAMCPAHRLDLLGLSKQPPPINIKKRLKTGTNCWVASTQLIEAGVDIDFPVVFRAMGPMDSIVQAAGRCNREGLLRDEKGSPKLGQVTIFHPQDAGLPAGIYSRGTAITPAYLKPQEIAENPFIFAQYFHELYQLTPMDFHQQGKHTIQEDRAEFRFRNVAKHAKVIKDETISVIVPYGKAKKIVDEIRETKKFDYNVLRQLQRYMVNIRNMGAYSDFVKLTALGGVPPLLPERLEIPVLGDWCYKTDPPLGVVIENRPLEDFIQ